ncbi:MAG: DNA polymerase IV [Bacillota bacterium]|nr:DNA polymerase IV [Bacillota bacterium]
MRRQVSCAGSETTIIHIDMDAFFAAVEQWAHPELRGKPVIVCGDPDGRGVVSTASYEARAFGVRSAMPVKEARRLCPQGVFLSSHLSDYAAISERLLEVYRRYTPVVEPFSIDEAFLDVTGCERLHGDAVAIARSIKEEVRRHLGLTCSVGVAPNKFLAKMASDMHKPDGLTVIQAEDVPRVIWPLPVGKLYGVGEKTAGALASMGITTAKALAEVPVEMLTARFGVMGRVLHDVANGIDSSPVDPGVWERPKSVGRETTLAEDSADEEALVRHLLSLSEQVARRLRKHDLVARTVTLKLRYSDFTTLTRSHTLDDFTCYDEDLYRAAVELFRSNWTRSRKVRLIGVTASTLAPSHDYTCQLALFEGPLSHERRRSLASALDRVRDRFGEGAVTRASLIDIAPRRRPGDGYGRDKSRKGG